MLIVKSICPGCILHSQSQAKEDEIRDWLGPAGDIKGLRLNRDKARSGGQERGKIGWMMVDSG